MQRFQSPLDEDPLAGLGQLVVRALVEVELDTPLLLLKPRLRLAGRGKSSAQHISMFETHKMSKQIADCLESLVRPIHMGEKVNI